jgi:hypothetical protein
MTRKGGRRLDNVAKSIKFKISRLTMAEPVFTPWSSVQQAAPSDDMMEPSGA